MIQDSILRTIQKFQMIKPSQTVLVAVSGGCDSSSLLHFLAALAPSWKLKLSVLHVNHKLRGRASDQDEAFVRALAAKYKIPFYATQVSIQKLAKQKKMSLEEAARSARYEFFERMAKEKSADQIVLAHTQDDQAETVLMRIIAGTGLQGLQAIRPKRKLNSAYLVRPLIETSRAEIRAYAKRNRIRFREDSSNKSLQFVRNKIRLKLIPMIEKMFNPQVKKALARLPHLLDVDLNFLQETAKAYYERLSVRDEYGQISFSKDSFMILQPSIQYRLIDQALRNLAAVELDYDHWNQFWGRLLTEPDFKFQFPKKLIVHVSDREIKIRPAKKIPVSFSHQLKLGESVYIPELNATLSCEELPSPGNDFKKSDKTFEIMDGDLLAFPLQVRTRKAGDYLQPLGQKTSSKLKGFLINKQVPAEKRDALPIILSKEQIIWVAGVAMSEPFKITPKSRRFVRLSLKPGNQI